MNESIRSLIQMGECNVDNVLIAAKELASETEIEMDKDKTEALYAIAFAILCRELNSKDPFMNKEKMSKIFKKTFREERPFSFILRGVEWEIIKEWINTLNKDLVFEKFSYINRIYIHELIEFWEEL